MAASLLKYEPRWRPHNTTARLDLVVIFREQRWLMDVIKTIRLLLALQPDKPQRHAIAAEAYMYLERTEYDDPHLAACLGTSECLTKLADLSP